MNLPQFHFLLTPPGQDLLAAAAETPITSRNHLQIITKLRQQVAPPLAQAVLQTAVLRQKAAVKFSRAEAMYFTRTALEQASSEIIAAYRAKRFAGAGMRTIVDLGCGIGGDALALTAVADVIGVDLDSLRLHMARENVKAYGGTAVSTPCKPTSPPCPLFP